MDQASSLNIKCYSSKIHISTTIGLLLITLTTVAVIWYLQFLWRRRNLYIYSRKLPGPFAFPVIGSAWKFMGDTYDVHCRMMKTYDDYPGIFRLWIGPKLLCGISDPKYHKVLLSTNLKKGNIYELVTPVLGHGLFTAPMEVWKRNKKIIMPTFNQSILNEFMEIFLEQSGVLAKHLEKFVDIGEFDAFEIISKSTLDIICETAMGVKINALTNDESPLTCIEKLLEITVFRIFHWWYYVDATFNLTSMSKQFWKDINDLHRYTEDVIRKKKKMFEIAKKENISQELFKDSKTKAFLDYLLEINNNRHAFTENELRDEVITFIIAGYDSTASSISFAFMMLGLYKDLQEKVYEEIIEVVGPNRAVEHHDLSSLKYLERFIKEILRLFPVAPFLIRDIDENVDLGEHIIPEGTTVVVGILHTHTNEKYWPDPFKFDPDRFLPEEVAKRHPCAYLPFSYGPRNCIGMKYAMMYMKTVLAMVLRQFRISTSYRSIQDIKLKTSVVLRPKDGYKISLKLR